MKKFNRNSIVTLLGLSFLLGLVGPIQALAATSPSLGTADDFAVLADDLISSAGNAANITGDVGLYAGSGAAIGVQCAEVNGTIFDRDAAYLGAGGGDITCLETNDAFLLGAKNDLGTAYDNLAAAPNDVCTTDYGVGPQDLTLVSPLAPGVYCVGAGGFMLTGNLTISGSGVYVFRSATTIVTSPGSSITGGDACNVWWRAATSVTLDTTTDFVGNVLALADISMLNGATLNGRALARNGQITLDTNTITVPVCGGTGGGGSGGEGTINVVKTVINDNGGTDTVADFPLFVNGSPVVSGVTNSFPADSDLYTVTETSDPNYVRTFSGDCDSSGGIFLGPGANLNQFCVITNDDIGAPVAVPPVPPLIDVVKVPNPLALPDGPGSVTYTYTTRNIGTVPMTNITMVGDTCSPIVLISGDTNDNDVLEVNETWVYRCTTTLSETHTNTVVATGWANNLSAVDVASATVVVGVPVVPPLIHVTKVPSPLTLLAGGGMVTYTFTVTNPGTVAINDVSLTDDRCSPLTYVSGDTDVDVNLDTNETWRFTCQANITSNTTNTVTVVGEANDIIVRDLAIAPVLVASAVPTLRPAAPGFPNTGVSPEGQNVIPLVVAGILAGSLLFYVLRKKRTA